jgi:hypothetical protein
MEQLGEHDIIGGTNHVLSLAILWGCVGIRYSKPNTVRKEESVSGGVVKLTSNVALDTPDGTTKLHVHISEKVRECGECVRLMTQRKGPRVISTIIQNNQIVLISRNTGYRRSPKITIDQIKSTYCDVPPLSKDG